ncbi:MAG: HAD family hydrolase [Gammaproteobacteria bacterium]|nr:HAD family hydrolase [Gammaproteobacteria bacterium]
MTSLAIFDLDNTLLSNDSDFLWGQFLVKQNIVDADYYQEKNIYFYEEYKNGTLDINEFLAFSLKPLADNAYQKLQELHQVFMEQEIMPCVTQKSFALINKHKQQNDYCLIITATNLFITAPIADYLGMNDIIATIPEMINGEYTGKVEGIPSFQDGKVIRLQQWLKNHEELNLHGSYFYSDSINDLPLLEQVSYPVAVDPDEKLLKHAKNKGWEIISLKT